MTFETSEGLAAALALPSPELRSGPISVEASRQKVAPDQRVAFVLNVDPEAQVFPLLFFRSHFRFRAV